MSDHDEPLSKPEEHDLAPWMECVVHRPVRALDPIPSGGSRTSYVVRMEDGDRYLLRVDDGKGPLSGTVFSIEREFRIISALHAAGFTVPKILAHHRRANALLMEFIDGRTRHQEEATPALRQTVQTDLMQKIVALHALAPEALGLADFARLGTIDIAIRHDLATLKSMYDRPGVPQEPEIDFSLNWLSRNIPDGKGRACLVHGDIGPGNFIFDDDGNVRALIDWEVAHMGHPLEDLAAVMCRALGAPFGTGPDHIEAYERISGETVDRKSLEFLLILVLTRWYIGLNMGLSHPSNTQNLPAILAYRQSVAFTLVSLLAKHHGIAPTIAEPLAAAESGYIHAYIIHTLEQVLRPAQSDTYLADRASGLAILCKYIRDLHAWGPERLERAEQADIEALTKRAYATFAAARHAACAMSRGAGPKDTPRLLEYLVVSSARKQRIWADAMGAMADRTLIY